MPPPRLILLPGLDGTGDLFLPLLSAIPPNHSTRVISYPPHQPLSYDDLLTRIDDQLSADENIILLAESFSGPLALRYAALNPAHIRAVILCASFIRSPVPRWLRFCITSLSFYLPPPSIALRHFLLGHSASPELVRALKRAIRKIRPAVLARRLKEIFDIDCSTALKQCPAPILYLAATHDALVRQSSISAIRAIRPDVHVVTLPGPHLLLQTHPAAAWRAIQQFLKTTAETR